MTIVLETQGLEKHFGGLKVTRDLSLILQALIILSVSAEGLWSSKLLSRTFFKRKQAVLPSNSPSRRAP